MRISLENEERGLSINILVSSDITGWTCETLIHTIIHDLLIYTAELNIECVDFPSGLHFNSPTL